MIRRSVWPIRLVTAGTALAGLAYALAFAGAASAGAWSLVAALAVLLPATMALGAPRAGRRGQVVRAVIWGAGGLFVVSFGLALALPATEGVGTPLVFGLPLRAAIVVYGAGALPMLILPLVYAWAFDAAAFDVERLRRLAAPPAGEGSAATTAESVPVGVSSAVPSAGSSEAR